MALTPAIAFGRLEMDYTAFGKSHVARFWVPSFGTDSGVGTFTASASPASLDALATELTVKIAGLFHASSSLAFGAWRGLKTTSVATGAGVPIVEGTITPGSLVYQASAGNAGAVAQATWSFRDAAAHVVKFVQIGCVYQGPIPYVYSSLGAEYLAFANYILGSTRIHSRNGQVIDGLIDVTFDTNDGLTRRYRR